MKKNIIIPMILGLALLCVVGFQQNDAWQYRAVRTSPTSQSIQAELNAYAKDGWELHSTMVIPNDQNQDTRNQYFLIFKKK